MSDNHINGYELQPEVCLVNGRPCRVFIPPIFFRDSTRLYWIKFLDDGDVTVVKEHDITSLKNGRLLYAKK
jgi:hypothetical protein